MPIVSSNFQPMINIGLLNVQLLRITSCDCEEDVEFYNGDHRLPVFTKEKATLRPAEVVTLLMASSVSSKKVCSMQPLRVEPHRSFVVDLQALRSVNDVKCDDMGSWQNNSANKFYFEIDVDDDGDLILEMVNKTFFGGENVVAFEAGVYSLNDGIHNDIRRRIDTIESKCNIYHFL